MSKKKEEALNALIKPIRKWLAGDEHRNALVILSEPKASTHLVLATSTTGNDMIPDMGLIVGMEPQLTDVLLMIHDFAMDMEPLQEPVADWEDTIDYTASSSGRPFDYDEQNDLASQSPHSEPLSTQSRTIVEPFPSSLNNQKSQIKYGNNFKHSLSFIYRIHQ